MKSVWSFVVKFFAAQYDSVKGFLNFQELFKSILSGFLAGGGVLGVLAAIHASLGSIITDQATLKSVLDLVTNVQNGQWTLVVAVVLGIVADALRRMKHGEDAVVVPVKPVVPKPDDFKVL
jgi:hypothetical protein